MSAAKSSKASFSLSNFFSSLGASALAGATASRIPSVTIQAVQTARYFLHWNMILVSLLAEAVEFVEDKTERAAARRAAALSRGRQIIGMRRAEVLDADG